MTSPHGPALMGGSSVKDALDGAVTAIAAAGCDTPRLDAELLLAHALGVSRERLLVDRDLTVAGPTVRVVQDYVRRRSVEREPVAYIVGTRHFRHIELAVDPRVLIPRPETELLVEVGLAALAPNARVLDLGTGSGAVALALKHERADLRVSASDASADALQAAQRNGERLGLDVRWLLSNLLEGIPDDLDAILSNPPYVGSGERVTLAPEIARHEPARALFAGPDGLDVIRPLIEQTRARASVSLLAIEIGAGQAPAVAGLMGRAGFHDVRTERDLAGIERVVVGERQ